MLRKTFSLGLRATSRMNKITEVLDASEFKTHVTEAAKDKTIMVDFYADWCGPCKMLAPYLNAAVDESKGNVELVKINVDDADPELPAKYEIRALPTVIFFKGGEVKHTKMGMMNKQVLDQILEKC